MRPSRLLIIIALGLSILGIILGVLSPQAMMPFLWVVVGFGVIALIDAAITPSRRALALEFDGPKEGYANSEIHASANVSARKGILPKNISTRVSLDEGLDLASDFERFGGVAAWHVDLALYLSKRGHLKIRKIYFCWTSRLRLFDVISVFELDHEIRVIPNVLPASTGMVQTQIMPLLDGVKNFNHKGEGSEFHQLREFVNGMDTRNIDWKRSARMRSLVVREVRAERNHQIICCIDNGHLMAQKIGENYKLDLAINASLALCWAGGLGGDQVGFYNFNARPGRYLPPRPGREAFPILRRECADLDYGDAETNHTWGLNYLGSRVQRRSLIVVYSDFVDSTSAELMVENLAIMRKQHVVLYVTLKAMTLDGFVATQSVELNEVAKAVAAADMKIEREKVFERLRRLGVLVLDVAPDELTPALLGRYMDIKLQELI